MSSEKRQKAQDLSHHLSALALARRPSPLKNLAKYYQGRPDVISLGGGMPAPEYFPFANISGAGLVHDSFSVTENNESSVSWFWKLFGAGDKEKTKPVFVPKFSAKPGDVNLATALQYGTAQGLVPLQDFIKEVVGKIYQPAYSDWSILVHTGNTDGWTKCVQTFCNSGEMIITEDWTYPSAVVSAEPYGIGAVPITMDSEGMRPDELRKVLAEWDEQARGAKRPHLIYTVPIGQNPTGLTVGLKRKQEIYDIAVEYDLLIVEDDHYYFLQEGPYVPKSERALFPGVPTDTEAYLTGLAPSYLRIDTQGRVVRIDTFSKTVAPGARLGYFTTNPIFLERLERQSETSSQAPCGFGQALITQLLTNWQYDGFTRWVHGLAVQYKGRRDVFIDLVAEEFDLKRAVATSGFLEGATVYDAFAKSAKNRQMTEKHALQEKRLFRLVPPTSGMFLWLQVPWENVPGFAPGDEESLEIQLFVKLADAGVLIVPGDPFAATPDVTKPREGHYRVSFSMGDVATFQKAVKIMGTVFRDFFHRP